MEVETDRIGLLPDELLSQTFYEYTHFSSRQDIHKPVSSKVWRFGAIHSGKEAQTNPIILGQVSSRWRSIALTTSTIWSSIYIDNPSLKEIPILASWIERSGTSQLELSLVKRQVQQDDDYTTREILSQLRPLIPRWKRVYLSFQLSEPTQRFLLGHSHTILPTNLQDLRVEVGGVQTPDLQVLYNFVQHAPKLQTFALRFVIGVLRRPRKYFNPIRHLSGHCLTELQLSSIFADILFPFLSSCQSLQILSLYALEGFASEKASHIPISSTLLPELQSITVGGPSSAISAVFPHLELPSLKELNLLFQFHNRRHDPYRSTFVGSLEDLIYRSNATLERLTCCFHEVDLKDLFHSPALLDLKLLALPGAIESETLELLIHTPTLQLFPKLETLILDACTSRDGLLSSVALSRTTPLSAHSAQQPIALQAVKAILYGQSRFPLDLSLVIPNVLLKLIYGGHYAWNGPEHKIMSGFQPCPETVHMWKYLSLFGLYMPEGRGGGIPSCFLSFLIDLHLQLVLLSRLDMEKACKGSNSHETTDYFDILPEELLSQVFHAYTHVRSGKCNKTLPVHNPELGSIGTIRAYENADATPIILGQVSSRWRKLAMSTRDLWSSIYINNPTHFDRTLLPLWIERSGNALLDIAFVIHGKQKFWGISLFPLLRDTIPRWGKIYFSLTLEYEVTSVMRDAIEGKVVPVDLTDVRIEINDPVECLGPGHEHLQVFIRSAPNLRRLSYRFMEGFMISSVNLDSICKLPAEKIGELQFPFFPLPDDRPLFRFLSESCTSLRTLSLFLLEVEPLVHGGGGIQMHSELHLPALETLILGPEFHLSKILPHLKLPSLKELVCPFNIYRKPHDPKGTPNELMSALEDLLTRSQTTLHYFTCSFSNEGLVEALASPALGDVKHLVLIDEVGTVAIEMLGRPQLGLDGTPGMGPLLLPQLEKLELRLCNSEDGPEVYSMVLSRASLPDSKLRSVKVLCYGSGDPPAENDVVLEVPGVDLDFEIISESKPKRDIPWFQCSRSTPRLIGD
ncbi:hypothetical protein FA15DRAFT_760658 [Coprinopsis marcescibilis]|uniref:F-box domain-containing protein n=1 Tax=Coprinopsis marcescibilis TaxID=230819 RepID=A0A5C3KF33_COPMA|nr:hypothetical protein FA15DRAFT_760658 [Coprinopsis marcescibilis]